LPNALLAKWSGLTFADLSRTLTKQLLEAGIFEADTDSQLLLAHVFGEDVWQKIIDPMEKPSADGLPKLAALTRRRLGGEPVSQILGEKGFWTLDLKVSRDVLTPRADTETLIEVALAQTKDQPTGMVLDLGTGSGAIVLAFLSERPHWRGIAIDQSGKALQIAQQNAQSCNLAERCEFVHGDWIDLVCPPADLVLSNPPYIASEELAELDVARYEPALALDGGEDGLDAYRVLARNLHNWLKPGANFAFEIGHTQAADVSRILSRQNLYTQIQTAKDLASRDRVVFGKSLSQAAKE
jgi:release factor glutamine methyltransferase